MEFFKKHKIPIETEMNNQELIKYISDNLKEILNKLESQEKEKLTERLDGCIKGRLDTWNYSDDLPGVEPKIKWRELIYPMIEYVNKQSNTFKDLYIQILITETTKKEQFTELHLIISPPFTIATLFKEWLEIHKENGDDPLDENDDPEKLTNNFLEYAKQQYNYDEKNDIEKKIIIDKIYNDSKVGINEIKDKFGILYFFGGKKIKNKKSRKKNKKFLKNKKKRIKNK